MRKLIFILFGLFLSFNLIAQEATDLVQNEGKTYRVGHTYAMYEGTTQDTLTTIQDTIDVVFNMRVTNGALVKRVSVGIVMDTIAGTDTLYEVTIFGEDFDSDTYTGNIVLAALETAVITTNTFDVWETSLTDVTASYLSASPGFNMTFAKDSLVSDSTASHAIFTNASRTNTVASYNITNAEQTLTSANLTWRKYIVRIIYSENGKGDEVGEGLIIESVELKLYTY